jgi:hypothetical protein
MNSGWALVASRHSSVPQAGAGVEARGVVSDDDARGGSHLLLNSGWATRNGSTWGTSVEEVPITRRRHRTSSCRPKPHFPSVPLRKGRLQGRASILAFPHHARFLIGQRRVRVESIHGENVRSRLARPAGPARSSRPPGGSAPSVNVPSGLIHQDPFGFTRPQPEVGREDLATSLSIPTAVAESGGEQVPVAKGAPRSPRPCLPSSAREAEHPPVRAMCGSASVFWKANMPGPSSSCPVCWRAL